MNGVGGKKALMTMNNNNEMPITLCKSEFMKVSKLLIMIEMMMIIKMMMILVMMRLRIVMMMMTMIIVHILFSNYNYLFTLIIDTR